MKATTQLQALFAELVKSQLSNFANVTINMLSNTIKHFAELTPFNNFPIEYWHTVCSAHNIKYNA